MRQSLFSINGLLRHYHQSHRRHGLFIIILSIALPMAVGWSGGPPNRSRSTIISSSQHQQLVESKLRQARTAVVSFWAAGVVLTSTSFSPTLTATAAAAASVPTTQIKINVETAAMERALEDSRGDVNDAVSQLAQTVPPASIRLIPPVKAELLQQEITAQPSEPLVDVDQMFLDAWQDFASIFSSRQQSPSFLSREFTVTVPIPGDTTQTVTLSVGPLLLVGAFLSYPLTYAFYQFEQDQEIKAAEAKKAALKAKQASKQKPTKQNSDAKVSATTKNAPRGSSSKTLTSPSTGSKSDENEVEVQAATNSEDTPSDAQQKVSIPLPSMPAPFPPPQEGGMDVYAQAYAAMLSASKASSTFAPEAQNLIPVEGKNDSPPQMSVATAPAPSAPSKPIPSSETLKSTSPASPEICIVMELACAWRTAL